MDILMSVLKVIHIASAVLLAWPYYALAAVNQRALLGPPFGDRTDTYMENVIKLIVARPASTGSRMTGTRNRKQLTTER